MMKFRSLFIMFLLAFGFVALQAEIKPEDIDSKNIGKSKAAIDATKKGRCMIANLDRDIPGDLQKSDKGTLYDSRKPIKWCYVDVGGGKIHQYHTTNRALGAGFWGANAVGMATQVEQSVMDELCGRSCVPVRDHMAGKLDSTRISNHYQDFQSIGKAYPDLPNCLSIVEYIPENQKYIFANDGVTIIGVKKPEVKACFFPRNKFYDGNDRLRGAYLNEYELTFGKGLNKKTLLDPIDNYKMNPSAWSQDKLNEVCKGCFVSERLMRGDGKICTIKDLIGNGDCTTLGVTLPYVEDPYYDEYNKLRKEFIKRKEQEEAENIDVGDDQDQILEPLIEAPKIMARPPKNDGTIFQKGIYGGKLNELKINAEAFNCMSMTNAWLGYHCVKFKDKKTADIAWSCEEKRADKKAYDECVKNNFNDPTKWEVYGYHRYPFPLHHKTVPIYNSEYGFAMNKHLYNYGRYYANKDREFSLEKKKAKSPNFLNEIKNTEEASRFLYLYSWIDRQAEVSQNAPKDLRKACNGCVKLAGDAVGGAFAIKRDRLRENRDNFIDTYKKAQFQTNVPCERTNTSFDLLDTTVINAADNVVPQRIRAYMKGYKCSDFKFPRNYNKIREYVNGDYTLTGNTILKVDALDTNVFGESLEAHVDNVITDFRKDSNLAAFTINSSSNDLYLPPDLKPEDIVFARLYWTGVIQDGFSSETKNQTNPLGKEYMNIRQNYPCSDYRAEDLTNIKYPNYCRIGKKMGKDGKERSDLTANFLPMVWLDNQTQANPNDEANSSQNIKDALKGYRSIKFTADGLKEVKEYEAKDEDIKFVLSSDDSMTISDPRNSIVGFIKNYIWFERERGYFFVYSANTDVLDQVKEAIAANQAKFKIDEKNASKNLPVSIRFTAGDIISSKGSVRNIHKGNRWINGSFRLRGGYGIGTGRDATQTSTGGYSSDPAYHEGSRMGNFGAWSLLVVYDKKDAIDKASQGGIYAPAKNERGEDAGMFNYYKPRKLTLKDGLATMVVGDVTGSSDSAEFTFDGFFTPKSDDYGAKVSIFSIGGTGATYSPKGGISIKDGRDKDMREYIRDEREYIKDTRELIKDANGRLKPNPYFGREVRNPNFGKVNIKNPDYNKTNTNHGNFAQLSNTLNPVQNQLNGTITVMKPGDFKVTSLANSSDKLATVGTDIDTFKISNLLGKRQTQATLRVGVDNTNPSTTNGGFRPERSFLSYVAFSTELYIPNICKRVNTYNEAGLKNDFVAADGETLTHLIIIENDDKNGSKTDDAEGLVVGINLNDYIDNTIRLDNVVTKKRPKYFTNANADKLGLKFLIDSHPGVYKDMKKDIYGNIDMAYMNGQLIRGAADSVYGDGTNKQFSLKTRVGDPKSRENRINLYVGHGAGKMQEINGTKKVSGGTLRPGELIAFEMKTKARVGYTEPRIYSNFSMNADDGSTISFNYDMPIPDCKDIKEKRKIKVISLDQFKIVNQNYKAPNLTNLDSQGKVIEDNTLYTQVAGKEHNAKFVYSHIGKFHFDGNKTIEDGSDFQDINKTLEGNYTRIGSMELSLVKNEVLNKIGCQNLTDDHKIPFIYNDFSQKSVKKVVGVNDDGTAKLDSHTLNKDKHKNTLYKSYELPVDEKLVTTPDGVPLKDLNLLLADRSLSFVLSYIPTGSSKKVACQAECEKNFESSLKQNTNQKDKLEKEKLECYAKCMESYEKDYEIDQNLSRIHDNKVNKQGVINICPASDVFSVRPAFFRVHNVDVVKRGGNDGIEKNATYPSGKTIKLTFSPSIYTGDINASTGPDKTNTFAMGYTGVPSGAITPIYPNSCNPNKAIYLVDGKIEYNTTKPTVGSTIETLWKASSLAIKSDFGYKNHKFIYTPRDDKLVKDSDYQAFVRSYKETNLETAKENMDKYLKSNNRYAVVNVEDFDGSNHTDGAFTYYNIGYVDINLLDQSWTNIDRSNGGCIEDSSSFVADSLGKVGCDTAVYRYHDYREPWMSDVAGLSKYPLTPYYSYDRIEAGVDGLKDHLAADTSLAPLRAFKGAVGMNYNLYNDLTKARDAQERRMGGYIDLKSIVISSDHKSGDKIIATLFSNGCYAKDTPLTLAFGYDCATGKDKKGDRCSAVTGKVTASNKENICSHNILDSRCYNPYERGGTQGLVSNIAYSSFAADANATPLVEQSGTVANGKIDLILKGFGYDEGIFASGNGHKFLFNFKKNIIEPSNPTRIDAGDFVVEKTASSKDKFRPLDLNSSSSTYFYYGYANAHQPKYYASNSQATVGIDSYIYCNDREAGISNGNCKGLDDELLLKNSASIAITTRPGYYKNSSQDYMGNIDMSTYFVSEYRPTKSDVSVSLNNPRRLTPAAAEFGVFKNDKAKVPYEDHIKVITKSYLLGDGFDNRNEFIIVFDNTKGGWGGFGGTVKDKQGVGNWIVGDDNKSLHDNSPRMNRGTIW